MTDDEEDGVTDDELHAFAAAHDLDYLSLEEVRWWRYRHGYEPIPVQRSGLPERIPTDWNPPTMQDESQQQEETMTYQYERLGVQDRLAQLDANLAQLEQMLFQSEMSLRMNQHRADDDESLIALQKQYDDNLQAIHGVQAMRIEIQGNGILEGTLQQHAADALYREVAPGLSLPPSDS